MTESKERLELRRLIEQRSLPVDDFAAEQRFRRNLINKFNAHGGMFLTAITRCQDRPGGQQSLSWKRLVPTSEELLDYARSECGKEAQRLPPVRRSPEQSFLWADFPCKVPSFCTKGLKISGSALTWCHYLYYSMQRRLEIC